jgi:FkbM family methyltransferase
MWIEGRSGAYLQAGLLTVYARGSRRWHKRGIGRVTWTLGRFFDDRNAVIVRRGDRRIRVPLNDGYWTPLLDPAHRYEPELHAVVERVVGSDTNFLDGGANIGYWSIMVQDRARTVVAVEASPDTVRRLEENLALNGNKVVCVHAALWSDDTHMLEMVSHQRRHVDGSVVEGRQSIGEPGITVSQVASTTIDALVERHVGEGGVVVKLDVEGAELQAIDGARRTEAERPLAFLYEDHGRDMDCAASAHLLERGYRLYALSASDPPAPIDPRNALATIRARKRSPRIGYNFAALSPSWPDGL